MKVLKSYLTAGNIWIFGVIIFCFLNRFVARVWYSWSLSQWTNDAEHALGSHSEYESSDFDRLRTLNNHYILVQGLLVLYETMAYLIVCCIWVLYGRRASEKIQRKFITLVTFAKTSFFDTFAFFLTIIPLFILFINHVISLNRTPLGRLISRFSRDFVCCFFSVFEEVFNDILNRKLLM